VPRGEITVDRPARDLADYRRREQALFAEVATRLHREEPRLPPLSRFDPASPTYPGRFGDWNRTFEMPAAGAPRGSVLLLHGLSDSPYSLRSIGALLASRGFAVVGLRVPGHGTVPGALAAVTREDWRAAVRLGAKAAATRGGQGPLLFVGYSNGAALALDYALAARGDAALPRPDGLVFLSPAMAVTGAARLGRIGALASKLPGFEGMEWDPVLPEYDPFKYNSFPIAAGYEIHALTVEIESRLAALDGDAAAASLPPVLTLQSVVDATVPPVPSLTRLYSRVFDESSELVLFDANRNATVAPFLAPSVDDLLALATPGRTFRFSVTLVTNESSASDRVVARTRAGGAPTATVEPLDLAWPPGVYSLAHVSLPFPPDDPVYGMSAPSSGPLPLGRLELKGERGAFLVPAELLSRLRYDPFFTYVATRVARFAERAVARSAARTPAPSPAPDAPLR